LVGEIKGGRRAAGDIEEESPRGEEGVGGGDKNREREREYR
jgi:hypothetical protein